MCYNIDIWPNTENNGVEYPEGTSVRLAFESYVSRDGVEVRTAFMSTRCEDCKYWSDFQVDNMIAWNGKIICEDCHHLATRDLPKCGCCGEPYGDEIDCPACGNQVRELSRWELKECRYDHFGY